MADWTDIPDTSLDPDAPLTSNLAYAWRDNPVAMAEGAEGAPKIAVKSAGGATGAGTLAFTGLDDFAGVVVHGHTWTDGLTRQLTVSLSDDGSTYATASTLLTDSVGSIGIGFTLFIDFTTGNFKCTHSADSTGYSSGTIAGGGSGVTAFRLQIGVGNISAVVFPNGGESAS